MESRSTDARALADDVSQQYERWIYPEPIMDVPEWLRWNWQWFDPSHAHRMLWPDRDYRPGMDILVAGCGTNQAAVIAYTNPTAKVVAVDVSEHSLDHHRYLARTYELKNLELHRLPIEEIAALDQDFDLIISTGVLHHLADPAEGLQALAACLRQEAVLGLMLYASYGRLGVEIMQSIFRDLGLARDEQSLAWVRDAIRHVNPHHPLVGYLQIAPDLADDAGVVDTFIHARERSYTIDECQEMVVACGLVFQDLFLKAPYYAPRGSGSEFLSRIAMLPARQQWSVMERMNTQNACHFFMACREDRPAHTYVIDFATEAARQYVPSFRKACRLEEGTMVKSSGRLQLDPWQAALVQRVDGHRSIESIIREAQQDGVAAGRDQNGLDEAAREVFTVLWQQDYLAMGLPPVA